MSTHSYSTIKLKGDKFLWHKKDSKLTLEGRVFAEFFSEEYGNFQLTCNILKVEGKLDKPDRIVAEGDVQVKLYDKDKKILKNWIKADKILFYPKDEIFEAYGNISASLSL